MPEKYESFEDLQLQLYDRFAVNLTFKSQVRGGVPKAPDVQEAWIKATVSDEHRVKDIVEQTQKETGSNDLTEEMVQEIKEGSWCGFKSNGAGPYLEGRCVKSMLKEGASVLRETLDLASFKSKVAERVFVEEEEIPLGVDEPDGSEESPVHAWTPQGPITALKRVDFVIQPTISFTIRALKQPLVTKGKNKIHPAAYVRAILEYAQDGGLGADRSQGYGKFTVDTFEAI